ncbi:MAG TPA: nucleotidyltransferase family protein [Mucilaginibacter sp.]|nr:nucleotidyltransferase family protein [Mucilaginibacter sp.]
MSVSQKYPVTNCAAIILAAGQSSRLGTPKQLLKYQGKSLLQHTINVAKHSSVQSIIVVLGSDFELMVKEIDSPDISIVKNENWHTGLASSIYCGINALKDIDPVSDAAILMVCDQPFISSELLDNLVAEQKATGKPIVASKYEDTIGIPALFHQSFFTQLQELEGDSGAKKIMQQHPDIIAVVPFPSGNIDIDTLGDYEALTK